MMRRILSVLILTVLLSWIVLSYAPATWVTLPQVAFTGGWSTPLFQLLAAIGLLGVGVIQLVLVRSTRRMLRPTDERADVVAEFGLRPGVELLWTALPLVMTVLLGVAIYWAWFALS
jgi:hypothetical protein